MPRGPLPDPDSRRRNAPTISNKPLPAEGRADRVPTVPRPYVLGDAGKLWWLWAWKLPQATEWDRGALYHVARRAKLEDAIFALGDANGFELEDWMDVSEDDREIASRIGFIIRELKSLAGGEVAIMKEMRELDNRLGLNPKAMLDLRWTISQQLTLGDDADGDVPNLDDYRDRFG